MQFLKWLNWHKKIWSRKMGRNNCKKIDRIQNVENARKIALGWLDSHFPESPLEFGLPEIDDRTNVWRVPLLLKGNLPEAERYVGEVIISAETGKIERHTDLDVLKNRIDKTAETLSEAKQKIAGWEVHIIRPVGNNKTNGRQSPPPFIPNKVVLGDAAEVLRELPPESIQLVITSPPYFNAKPEYAEYLDYQEYLDFLRKVFLRCHEVLCEGRFFVINVSPVLIRRVNRQSSSRRIPVPFDVHQILSKINFDFIDDIIWVKPEGAGWATGRGRRFAADRNPLQYKPVPVTEYVLVYRKRTSKLIDWNIRTHYDPELVKQSKIEGDYNVTNVWNISPGHHKEHPAVFPDELVQKLIRYYSFKGDCVLDPFAGSGTVGESGYAIGTEIFFDRQ